MAYSNNAYGTFGGRPNHRLNLYVYTAERDIPNRRAKLAWGLYAERTSGVVSYYNNPVGFSVNVGGNITNGAGGLPFSSTVSQIQLAIGEHWFSYDGNGDLTVWFSANMQTAGQFGSAQTSTTPLSPDGIGPVPPAFTVPGAPIPLSVSDITSTAIRYRFSGTSDGGTPIREWQIGYGTDPNGPQAYVSSSGDSTITGLTPADDYYFWSRGRNDIGWSGLSSRVSGRTLPGGHAKVGGAWRSVIPHVKVGGVWRRARPFAKATTWHLLR